MIFNLAIKSTMYIIKDSIVRIDIKVCYSVNAYFKR